MMAGNASYGSLYLFLLGLWVLFSLKWILDLKIQLLPDHCENDEFVIVIQRRCF